MGYTHYFAYDPSAESFVDAWPQMVTDAWLIASYVQVALGIPLAGADGQGAQQITKRHICLNGPALADLGHRDLPDRPRARRLRQTLRGRLLQDRTQALRHRGHLDTAALSAPGTRRLRDRLRRRLAAGLVRRGAPSDAGPCPSQRGRASVCPHRDDREQPPCAERLARAAVGRRDVTAFPTLRRLPHSPLTGCGWSRSSYPAYAREMHRGAQVHCVFVLLLGCLPPTCLASCSTSPV